MIRVKFQILGLVLLAAFLCTADVFAQGGGRGRGGGFGSSQLLDLLSNEAVQKELEMSDDQVAEIEELREGAAERRSEAIPEIREMFRNGGNREEAMGKAREVFGELAKEVELEVEDLLIGEQFDRLKQISIQRDLAGRNSRSALNKLLDLVEATDDEKDKFEEVKDRLEKEAAKKIAKIRSQTVEQIARQSLSDDKADKFMEFIGEAMEGSAEAFQDRGRGRGGDDGGRGGRGGRGGDDGGRGGRGGDGGKGGKGGKGGGKGGRSGRPEGDDF